MTYQGIELSSYLKDLYSKYLEITELKPSDKSFEYFIVDAFIEFYKSENYFNRTEEETNEILNYLRKHKELFSKTNNCWYLKFSITEPFTMLYERKHKGKIFFQILSAKYFKPFKDKLDEIQRI